MAALGSYHDDIVHFVEIGKTHAEISEILKSYGKSYGSSERSVRRYCQENDIRKNGEIVRSDRLLNEVAAAVQETGPTYGRKMMKGYLASKGVHASADRIGNALAEVNPQYHSERQQGARNLNPRPYRAAGFGDKLHIDQNEKLVMYGLTHIIAVDGFSDMVVGYTSMPTKNNLLIYENVYKPAVLQFGPWNQVRVDHGREFYLTLYAQQQLAPWRRDITKPPFLQTKSTRNHKVERMWPEVNNRFNYPLKSALIEMEQEATLNMDDDIDRFCASSLLLRLAPIGLSRVVQAWNFHSVPGKGVPSQIATGCTTSQDWSPYLPPAAIVAEHYCRERHAMLTAPVAFVEDPFRSPDIQQYIMADFGASYPDLTYVLNETVNRNYVVFKSTLYHLLTIAKFHHTQSGGIAH